MANFTIDSEGFYLVDQFPGVPDVRLSVPKDGFTGADHHNVSAAAYPIGTKIQVYNKLTAAGAGVLGYSVMLYAKLEMQDATNVLAARHFVTQHSDAVPYDLTNDAATDIGTGCGAAAVGLGPMTVDYYGWFWCGGVCPESFVSDLGGSYYARETGAVIGTAMLSDLATPGTTAGELGLATAAGDAMVVIAVINVNAA